MTVLEEIRNEFPQLAREVYKGKPLVYFDNAATAQRPQSVLDAWYKYSAHSNANVHRSVYLLAEEATNAMEEARENVVKFLNAPSAKNIIFTSGATASLNLLANCFTAAFCKSGDEIILSSAEHHSNIVPWQIAAQQKGLKIKVWRVDENGELDLEELKQLITERTKIVSVAHISNVLGVINPIKEIAEICHEKGVAIAVDGSQGVIHQPIDFQALNLDFYVFSAHKIYAATGVGVLCGTTELLDAMPPFLAGGEMIDKVSFEETTYAPLPLKFEAGTPNYSSIATLTPALEMAERLRTELHDNEQQITEYLLTELQKIEGLKLYGTPKDRANKIGLFSMSIGGVHHEDLALILDKMGICVRSGELCAAPLMQQYGVSGMLRASVAPYNTLQEAEYFITGLKKAINMLR